MGFFGWVFWMVLFWFVFSRWHRWHRWHSMAGPQGLRAYARRWDSGRWSGPRGGQSAALETRGQSDDQQPYIDALETRVSELEERLDFTERLIAERGKGSS